MTDLTLKRCLLLWLQPLLLPAAPLVLVALPVRITAWAHMTSILAVRCIGLVLMGQMMEPRQRPGQLGSERGTFVHSLQGGNGWRPRLGWPYVPADPPVFPFGEPQQPRGDLQAQQSDPCAQMAMLD